MDTTSSLLYYFNITYTHTSIYLSLDIYLEGFPGGASNKEPAYQCRRASLVAQLVKNLPAAQETRVQSLGQENPWRRKRKPTPVFLPGGSHGQRRLAGYSQWGRMRQT